MNANNDSANESDRPVAHVPASESALPAAHIPADAHVPPCAHVPSSWPDRAFKKLIDLQYRILDDIGMANRPKLDDITSMDKLVKTIEEACMKEGVSMIDWCLKLEKEMAAMSREYGKK